MTSCGELPVYLPGPTLSSLAAFSYSGARLWQCPLRGPGKISARYAECPPRVGWIYRSKVSNGLGVKESLSRHCLPVHRVPFNSNSKGLTRVSMSMTWRATSARPYPHQGAKNSTIQ